MSEETVTNGPGPARQRRVSGGRSKRYVVRVDERQEELLRAKALHYNVSVPKLMVDAALSSAAEVAADNASTQRELIVGLFASQRLLARLSANVNQIARATHSNGGQLPPSLEGDLQHTAKAVRATAFRIEEFLDQMDRLEA